MIVVRSLKSASVTHQVHGIFWKSVTGYDILKDAATPDAATPDAATPDAARGK